MLFTRPWCWVCQEVSKVLTREANTLREEKAKGPKHLPLTEHDILEKVEKVGTDG